MFLGQHQHQPILPKGSGFQFLPVHCPFNHCHIQQIIPQHLLQPFTVGHRHLQWAFRVLHLPLGSHPGQQKIAQCHAASHPKRCFSLQPLFQPTKLFQYLYRPGIQRLACSRDIQPPSQSFKQRYIILFFQLPNRHRHRRLCHIQFFCSSGNAFLPIHLHEDLQMPDGHLFTLFS